MGRVEYNDIIYGSLTKRCWVLRTRADHVANGRRDSVIRVSSGRQRHAFSGWVSFIVHLRRRPTMPHRPTFYSLASENLQFATWPFFKSTHLRAPTRKSTRANIKRQKRPWTDCVIASPDPDLPPSHPSHRTRPGKRKQSKRTITAHAHRGSSSCPRGSRRRRRYHRGDQRRRPGGGPRSGHRGPPGKRSSN